MPRSLFGPSSLLCLKMEEGLRCVILRCIKKNQTSHTGARPGRRRNVLLAVGGQAEKDPKKVLVLGDKKTYNPLGLVEEWLLSFPRV